MSYTYLQSCTRFFRPTVYIIMTPSKQIESYIKDQEGLKLTPYKLGANWHVGYGHLLGAGPLLPMELAPISRESAESIFDEDLKNASQKVSELTTSWTTQPQHDALTDFVFNLGSGTYRDSELRTKINSGAPLSEIDKEFDRFVYYKNSDGQMVPSKVLAARRDHEFKLFEQGSKRKKAIVGGGIFLGIVIIVIVVLLVRKFRGGKSKSK